MAWGSSLVAMPRDERVILAIIGVATFASVRSIIAGLAILRDFDIVPPPEPKTQYITQDTEDGLELKTIERLLNHPSYPIRDAASRILCDRAINDSATMMHLLVGITRPDYDERLQCLRALALLINGTSDFDGISVLNSPKPYSALVRSLQLSLGDTERLDLSDADWDEYSLRDPAERICLKFAFELVNKHGASPLVKAKFVEKWLVEQDWGCELQERRRRFLTYTNMKNNRLAEIINAIKQSRRGLRALEKAGLIEEECPGGSSKQAPPPEIVVAIEDEHVGDQAADQTARRTREQSAEERRLRRQHREAMVLNDGTRPVGREDIIERDEESA